MQRLLSLLMAVLCLPGMVYAQLTVGLIEANPSSSPGYTLMAPLNSTNTYLIDQCGRLVHQWQSDHTSGAAAYLCPNGDLLRLLKMGNSPLLSGIGGGIERRSWDGELLWKYVISDSNFAIHHDAVLMPNGNILALIAERIPKAEAQQAGRDTAYLQGDLLVDAVYEIQPVGDTGGIIVWKWRLMDHVVQDISPDRANYASLSSSPGKININFVDPIQGIGMIDFSHANSIDYNPETDEILISARNFNEIWILDHSTTTQEAATSTGGRHGKGGELIFRWGNPAMYGIENAEKQLFGQHNARWITQYSPMNGKIMVFNNGLGRQGGQYATVNVLTPTMTKDGAYVREEDGTYSPVAPDLTFGDGGTPSLQSVFMSGASFTNNGTLRITEALLGRISEYRLDNMLLWSYVNPVVASGPLEQGANPAGNIVFRSELYSPNYPAFAGKTLVGTQPIELNPVVNNCTVTNPTTVVDPGHIQVGAYPNPFTSELEVTLDAEASSIAVVNALGEVVVHVPVDNSSMRLSLGWLPAGTYVLRANCGQGLVVVKLP